MRRSTPGSSLSREQFALAVKLALAESAAGELRPLPRRPGDTYPASFGQQRLWFLEQLQPGAYHLATAVDLEGALNIGALEASLRQIIARHEILRTNLVWENGQVRQQV